MSLNTAPAAPAAPTAPAAVGRVLVATFRFLAHVSYLVSYLVWPHGGPISMRPRALRTMQDP